MVTSSLASRVIKVAVRTPHYYTAAVYNIIQSVGLFYSQTGGPKYMLYCQQIKVFFSCQQLTDWQTTPDASTSYLLKKGDHVIIYLFHQTPQTQQTWHANVGITFSRVGNYQACLHNTQSKSEWLFNTQSVLQSDWFIGKQ